MINLSGGWAVWKYYRQGKKHVSIIRRGYSDSIEVQGSSLQELLKNIMSHVTEFKPHPMAGWLEKSKQGYTINCNLTERQFLYNRAKALGIKIKTRRYFKNCDLYYNVEIYSKAG